MKTNALPKWSPAPSRPRCQGRVVFAFTEAQRTPLTEEAGGLGAVFTQEGQRGIQGRGGWSRGGLIYARKRDCLADLQLVPEEREIFAVDVCQLLQLHNVHSPFAELTLGDEGIGASQPLCDFHLCKTCFLAGLD